MNTYHNSRICERRNLEILLPILRNIFPNCVILVIDDGSTDGTDLYLNDMRVQDSRLQVIFRRERLGIGSAHLTAIEFAVRHDFEYLITMDGDLTHSPYDAHKILTAINENDLIIGSRYLDSGKMLGWSLHRLLLTQASHLATRFFFNSELDMSSGLRAYLTSRIPLRSLKENCPANYDFFFISTLVYLSQGLTVGQTGATLNTRASGKSKMNLSLVVRGVTTLLTYGLRLKRIRL
jgi:dolichol-phosphate mannosyltransferase